MTQRSTTGLARFGGPNSRYHLKRPLWYIAKATLFSFPPIGFFLRRAHLLPIQRRQDGPVNAEQNEATFEAVISKPPLLGTTFLSELSKVLTAFNL